jgi:hypothetical protein
MDEVIAASLGTLDIWRPAAHPGNRNRTPQEALMLLGKLLSVGEAADHVPAGEPDATPLPEPVTATASDDAQAPADAQAQVPAAAHASR